MTAQETETFGSLLRRFRLGASLSQEALAERARLSTEGISKLERGRRTARPETVQLLVDALGLAPSERASFLAAAYPQTVPTQAPTERPSTLHQPSLPL